MNNLLIILDADIKRCEDILKINNYLEIVIAIEELLDKHKQIIGNEICISDKVWSYSKKDLENILSKLKSEKEKILTEYYNNQVKNRIIDKESLGIKTIYETQRLYLKIIDNSKSQQVLDYYMRNKEFLCKYEEERDSNFYKIETHQQNINNDLVEIKEGNSLKLWIYDKNDDSKIIGAINFTNIIRGSFLSCFLGYKLDKDEINKGYMTEALKKSIEIIFNEFKLHRIEANIMPSNNRSLEVVKKLNFREEGIALNYLKINGKWEDHIHMVLLNEDI